MEKRKGRETAKVLNVQATSRKVDERRAWRTVTTMWTRYRLQKYTIRAAKETKETKGRRKAA